MSKELSEMTLEELWVLFPIILTEHKDVRRRITIGCNSKLKSRLTPIRPRGLACNCTFLSA